MGSHIQVSGNKTNGKLEIIYIATTRTGALGRRIVQLQRFLKTKDYQFLLPPKIFHSKDPKNSCSIYFQTGFFANVL